MQFSRVLHRTRILLGLGLFGLLAFTVGCDSGGGGGESAVTPSMPPPGRSAKEQMEARAKSYPTGPEAKAVGSKTATEAAKKP